MKRLLLIGLVLATGCKKKATEATPAAVDAAPAQPKGDPAAAGVLPPAAAPVPVAARGFDAVIGPETGFAVGVDFTKVQKSKVWKKLTAPLFADGKEQLAEITKGCGFDPLAALQQVVFTGSRAYAEESLLVALRGQWDDPSLRKCFDGLAAAEKKSGKSAREGSFTTFTDDKGETMRLAWVAPDTMVYAPGKMQDPKALEAAVAQPGPSGDFKDVLARVDRGAAIWGAALIPAAWVEKRFKKTPPDQRPDAAWITIEHDERLKLTLATRVPTDAGALAVRMEWQAELAKSLADRDAPKLAKQVTFSGEGRWFKVVLDLDAKQVDELVVWLEDKKNRDGLMLLIGLLLMDPDEMKSDEKKPEPPAPEPPTEPPNEPTAPAEPTPAEPKTGSTGADPEGGDFTLAEATAGLPGDGKLMARISTVHGSIECELRPDLAPRTVASFVGLARGTRPWRDPDTWHWVNRPFFDGLAFHRVIPGFMIQGGDPLSRMYSTSPTIGSGGPGFQLKGEFQTSVKYDAPGRLAMARSQDPDSAGSQFFVTDGKATQLDGAYTIFGLCSDLAVISKIAGVAVGPPAPENARPVTAVTMKVEIYRKE